MGFTLGIRYLMGWTSATHPSQRELAEWPPHPDRIYMALAAAFFETDADPNERQALEWLESQDSPTLFVSRAVARSQVTAFVPINDNQMPRWKPGATPSLDQAKGGLSLLPPTRSRQPRQFPTAVLEDEVVFVEWTGNPDGDVRTALQTLARKVTRIGHSSSLVQVWIEDAPATGDALRRIAPSPGLGNFRLRVAGTGRLASLEASHRAGRRPVTSPYRAYTDQSKPVREAVQSGEFSSDLVILKATPENGNRRFGLRSTLLIAHHLRRTLLAECQDPLPEWLCGHRPDGSMSEAAHLALLPLAHVGREHADGHLLGFALAVPRSHIVDSGEVLGGALLDAETLGPLNIEVKLGEAGTWWVSLEDRDEVPLALQADVWTRPSLEWATVTPVVLDRHPKKGIRRSDEGVAQCIRNACNRIGLPQPEWVEFSKTSMFIGAPSVYEYPPVVRKDGSIRQHIHCVLRFPEPVAGPVLLGAGRYRGYGFCRPWRSK